MSPKNRAPVDNGSPLRILATQSEAHRITRRGLLAGFAVAGAGLALTACAGGGTAASAAKPDGQLEDELNVYSWGDYDDPDVLAEFQARGVGLQIDSFSSNEELVAKLGAARGTSGYDIVVPSGYYIPMMANAGLLEKLDHRYLPNLDNLEPVYRRQPWDASNEYSVCKNWGTTGFVYDTRVIKRDLTSWHDFFTAATGEARGRTSVLGDPWEACSMFLADKGFDLNTTNSHELDLCEAFMVDTLAPTVGAFSAQVSTLVQGQFPLMQAYNGDVRLGLLQMDDPEPWRWVFAAPTANRWTDTWAIAKGAQHIDAAYAFINYILEPEVGKREMEYIGYPTGLKGQQQLALSSDLALTDLIYPPPEVVDRLVPSEVNEGTGRRVQIFNRMQARASA